MTLKFFSAVLLWLVVVRAVYSSLGHEHPNFGIGLQVFSKHYWPGGTIPYEFSPHLDKVTQKKITFAMWYLSIHSCVRFTEIQSDEEVHRVVIKPSKGSCSTNIGYKPDTLTFRQLFLVGPSCTVSKWHLMHQLLQLAGLYPEQRHYNRVRYLLVDMEAIQQDHHLEYAKLKGAFGFLMTLGLPYDPTSLLQYNNNIFSVEDNIQTMLLKVKEFNGTLGQREDFSATDRARLNRLYMCWGHYLGDDQPGAVPYLYWFNTFLSP